MIEEGVPSVNPKLDAMCEMLKTIHNLNERNKMLEAQIEKMKCCRICVYYEDLAISDWSPCKTCKNKSNWEFAD